jgi:hypothetical protein
MQLRTMLVAAILVVGCGQSVTATNTPSTTPTVAPTNAPTIAPTISPEATPGNVLVFPTASEQELAPGRYSSSPPFDIPFTFEVQAEGWESAHLHGEFFDIMQLPAGSTQPSRWIAWAHPLTIHGPDDAAAIELSPAEAAELLAARADVDATDSAPFQFAGHEGVRLDLTTDDQGVQIFGGEDGDFGLDPAYDLRLGLVSLDDDLMLVLVLAPTGELEDAWMEAQPVLDSATLAEAAP